VLSTAPGRGSIGRRAFTPDLPVRQARPPDPSARPVRPEAILNRVPPTPSRLSLVLAVAVVLVGVPLAGIAAADPVTLAASRSTMTFGGAVTLSGTVTTGVQACDDGRTVQLAWRATDATTWTVVDTRTTDPADGSFSFSNGQDENGRFRAQLPATGSCGWIRSNTVLVRVRAFVDSSLLAGSLTVGSCVDVHAQVSPPKPGDTVDLQRRQDGAWTTIRTLTLDADSSIDTSPCFGWADLGIVRLRVVWPSQDTHNATGTGITLAFKITRAGWMIAIDDAIGGRSVSVEVADAGRTMYARAPTTPRRPASNDKLLLSMALLDRFGGAHRIPTIAAAAHVRQGVVRGNLWILGRGDPEIRGPRLGALATRLQRAGVSRIRGRVMGATTYFRHDWWARGWQPGWHREVAMPTALTFGHNVVRGREIVNPEVHAAAALTAKLEGRGISVRGRPGAGVPPSGAAPIAQIESRPLTALLARMDRPSDNFYAEVLGKALGAARSGPPGTIPKSAAAIRAFTGAHGVSFRLYDASGLSYADRVTADGVVHLLAYAETAPWGGELRRALPTGGQGTLRDRLHDVRFRAKTGTLNAVSALSGWVWLQREHRWAEFSILSSGMSKATSVRIEDRIVRIVSNRATDA
jgi:serine-type D-Ala-D-Ala carboxypeptidase/endopeptidase (penicillin-binding protein 4)